MSGWAWGPRPPEPVLDAVGALGITTFLRAMMPHTLLDAGGLAHRRAAAGGVLGLRSGILRAAPEVRIVTLNMGLVRDYLPMLAPLIEGRLVAEGRPR